MSTRDFARSARLVGAQAVMLFMLIGCNTLSELPVQTQTETRDAAPATSFSYSRVVELMLEGRAERAEDLLRARIEAAPGDTRSRDLLRQIEASPTEFLGPASFQYEVQPGESLSVLAQRFLGNYRLFFILARYNDIPNPSLLQAGQTLRIPSDYWDGPAPSREPLDREIRAREYLADSRPRQALALYEDVPADALGRDEFTVLETAHQRWIQIALDDGDLAAARERLEAARRQAPANGRWAEWLEVLTRRTTAETAYRRALSVRGREPARAARALNRALQVDPGHSRARQALSELRSNTVPELHREAVILYRHQNLDEAIRLWDQALVIDPEFAPAHGYRTRAEELRRRLEALQ